MSFRSACISVLLSCLLGNSLAGMNILVGTYTPAGARSEGVYLVQLDGNTGELSPARLAAACRNPTFLALGAGGTRVLATGDIANPAGGTLGGLRSFSWDAGKAVLTPLSELGFAPQGASTHVSLSLDSRTAFAVHYNAAWVGSASLTQEGKLERVLSLHVHEGRTGPQQARQDKAHAHSIMPSPDGRHAYVCDLGLDQVVPYAISSEGVLSPLAPYHAEPGAGPRHSRFSADGRFLYVLNELAGSLSVLGRNSEDGSLQRLQTVSVLPEGFTGENTSAEVQLHPNGRFLYASSRGPDLLTVLERGADGLVSVVQRISCGGRHPRHFALSPDGRWLVCANRDSDSLTVFSVDAASGRLSATGFSAVVPQAVCVLFVP